jgi:hypothetical protein
LTEPTRVPSQLLDLNAASPQNALRRVLTSDCEFQTHIKVEAALTKTLEIKMKKIILAAAVLASFTGVAMADTDGEYIMKDETSVDRSIEPGDREIVTEPFAAPARSSVNGCDSAAGGAGRLDACSPDGQAAGGGNSGGQSR